MTNFTFSWCSTLLCRTSWFSLESTYYCPTVRTVILEYTGSNDTSSLWTGSIRQQLHCHVRHSVPIIIKCLFINSLEFLGWMREKLWTNTKCCPRSNSRHSLHRDWSHAATGKMPESRIRLVTGIWCEDLVRGVNAPRCQGQVFGPWPFLGSNGHSSTFMDSYVLFMILYILTDSIFTWLSHNGNSRTLYLRSGLSRLPITFGILASLWLCRINASFRALIPSLAHSLVLKLQDYVITDLKPRLARYTRPTRHLPFWDL